MDKILYGHFYGLYPVFLDLVTAHAHYYVELPRSSNF